MIKKTVFVLYIFVAFLGLKKCNHTANPLSAYMWATAPKEIAKKPPYENTNILYGFLGASATATACTCLWYILTHLKK